MQLFPDIKKRNNHLMLKKKLKHATQYFGNKENCIDYRIRMVITD